MVIKGKKLMDKVEKVLSDRGSEYGKFSDVADVYYDLLQVINNHDSMAYDGYGASVVQRSAQCALDMVCMKIARLVSGSRCHRDSWLDIAGYAMLVVNDIDEMEQYNSQVVSICEDCEENES